MVSQPAEIGIDRFVEEQMFEEDVRTMLSLLRPNRRQRLQGWREYRTGGDKFRATVSWDPEFEVDSANEALLVPHMADVLEAILVGSTRSQDELTAEEEFGIYRRIVGELHSRLNELEARYY